MTTEFQEFTATTAEFKLWVEMAEAEPIKDPEVLKTLQELLSEEANAALTVFNVYFNPDTDTFQGRARQRISAGKSQYYGFRISPDQMVYKLTNPDEMVAFAAKDAGFSEIVEFAAKSGRKLNCKAGNVQCGGKCQSGKLNCYHGMTPAQKKAAAGAAKKAKGATATAGNSSDGKSGLTPKTDGSPEKLFDTFLNKPDKLPGESPGDRFARWKTMKDDAVNELVGKSERPNSLDPEKTDWGSLRSTSYEQEQMLANLAASNPARRDWVTDAGRLKDSQNQAGNPPFPSEVLALKLYTTNDFGAMNGALRGLSDDQYSSSLNPNMASGRSPNDIRAEALRDARVVTSALNSLPPYEGVVFRGVRVPPGMTLDDIKAAYQPGQAVTERGFTSTSATTDASFASRDDVPVQMVINSRSGRSIEQYSETSSEREVLFRPFTQFRVAKQEEVNGQLVIYMDEVDG